MENCIKPSPEPITYVYEPLVVSNWQANALRFLERALQDLNCANGVRTTMLGKARVTKNKQVSCKLFVYHI